MSSAKNIALNRRGAHAAVRFSRTRSNHRRPGAAAVWGLSTGGTISGQGATSTSLAEYKSGALLGEQLVAGVPDIRQVASVKVEQIVNVSSTDITIANWLTSRNESMPFSKTIRRSPASSLPTAPIRSRSTAHPLNLTVKS